jgi:DNA polymerase
MALIIRDIETRSAVDLKTVGAHRYAADSTTDIWCCAYCIDDGEIKLWAPGDPIPEEFAEAASNPSWLTAAFNNSFERLIEQHILGPRYRWPLVPAARHRCLQAAALALALPASLDGVAKALELPHQKDAAGRRLMLQMAKPRLRKSGNSGQAGMFDSTRPEWWDDPERREKLYAYCKQDVATQRALYQRIGFLPENEQACCLLDAAINDRGFYTDGALLDAAHRVVTAAAAEQQEEFRNLTGLASTNQVDRFINWLAGRGCAVDNATKTTLRHALRRNGLAPDVRRALELRLSLAHASATKIEALRTWRSADGRVRGTLKYHGAATGRWTGHGPRPQNFKRDTTDTDAKIAAVMNGGPLQSPVETVGEIARAMICAAPGSRLLVADFSGIESRVLAWVSGQQSKIDAWAQFDRTGRHEDDPYVRIAARCGLSGDGARDIGKRIDLSFGFGGGVGAWQRSAPEGDTTDELTAERYKNTWRTEHPETVRFWYALDRAAIGAVNSPGKAFPAGRVSYCFDAPFLRVTLPSGRAISYPFARIAGPDKFGNPRLTFSDNADGKFTECRFGQGAWFGMLVENVVQAIARDLLAAALMRLEAAGYPVILHVHDEVVCETPNDFGSVEEFHKLVTTVPAWASGLPVAAKVRNGPRFAKASISGQPEAPGQPCPEMPEKIPCDQGFETPKNEGEHPEEEPTEEPADSHQGNGSSDDAGHDAFTGYASGGRPWGSNVAEYVYVTDDGQPYLKVRRTSAKQFPQYHWNSGQWVTGAPKGPRIPYRLPELIAAAPDVPVWIAEGEKDAENAAALGLITTTNSGGAGKWSADLNKWFAVKQTIYVLEDNDTAGRAHARKVADSLCDVVPEIRIVSFTELLEHGDASDWIESGGTREQLLERAKAAPKYERPKLPFINMSRWDGESIPEQEWTVPFKIPAQECAIFSGEGGAGKSMEGLHLCAAHVLGGECWHTIVKRGPAIFIDAEDTETVIHRRLAAVREHYAVTFTDLIRGGLHLISLVGHDAVLATVNRSGKIDSTPLYAQLLQAAGDITPVQIVIASSANVFAGNENDRSQAQQFISLLARLAMTAGGSCVLISHPSLTGINSGSGLSGSTAWHNAVRARFVMRGIKPEEGEQPDGDLREIVFMKSQHSALSESIVVRFQNGMFLPADGASLDQAAREAKADEIFLQVLWRFTNNNRFVSDKRGTNFAPALFAKEDEAKREVMTSKALEGSMRRLFRAGTIWNEPCGKPSRPSYRIAIRTQ